MSETVTKQDVDVYLGHILDFEPKEIRDTKTYENYSRMFFTEGDKQYGIMYLNGKWSEPILISEPYIKSEPRTFKTINEIDPLPSGNFHTKETILLMRKFADLCVSKKLIDMGYKDHINGDPESELAEMETKMAEWEQKYG